MTFDITAVLGISLMEAAKQVGKMALILIPIIIFLEILRDLQIVDRGARFFGPAMRYFRLPGEAAIPLLVGLVFGILYGAGVLVQEAREGKLNKRQLTVVGFFLAINHAAIEDPLLFTILGANYLLIQAVRFGVAIVLTLAFAAWYLPPIKREQSERQWAAATESSGPVSRKELHP
ncbi:nucleoside recognition domain-containing protein [Heliophilum fasciatum]|uniref:Nucleoside recognition protein n=1 Tax=Heliophilum fasciatum TaxID=35700 RepID=A0A4R2RN16_9FIRM|nr:nucleoside recognition domain-containing protein [Heliophilum fasciatum]MCW2278012.1 hypothetical protein [Heliophilum fasciatum]TCP64368.1 nucleoside recognition protein [Heliophilum fasciatum]